MDATTHLVTENVMAEKDMDWAISSQATEESAEGSTTNAYGPERPMKRHERGATNAKSIYNRKYREKNRDKLNAYLAEYRKNNRDELLLKKKVYYLKNREKHLADFARYHAQNAAEIIRRKRERRADPVVLARHNEAVAKRRAAEVRATPKWANRNAISGAYLAAQRMRLDTGIDYQVDHFYPLLGKKVCGLHVESNLQIITASANARKQNKMVEEIV
jgi:hypothetical protein